MEEAARIERGWPGVLEVVAAAAAWRRRHCEGDRQRGTAAAAAQIRATAAAMATSSCRG